MSERRPISSSKQAGRTIGYIEGDRALDLFARPCASYDCDTGLLRDPNTQAIVGYVTFQGLFVGSSQIAEELFPESVPSRSPGTSMDTKVDGVQDECHVDSLNLAYEAFRGPHEVSSGDTQNEVVQDGLIPVPQPEFSDLLNQGSTPIELGGKAPVTLADPSPSMEPSPPPSAPPNLSETNSKIDETSSQSEAPSASNENGPFPDSQRKQPALDLPKHHISTDFQRTLDALECELELAPPQTLRDEPERQCEATFQNGPEPLRHLSHQGEPQFLNEASLQGEFGPERSLQSAPDAQVALTIKETEAASIAVAEPSEVAVSDPHEGDVGHPNTRTGSSGRSALSAVDTFMLHLAEYLDAPHRAAESDIDCSRPGGYRAPPPRVDSPNQFQHKVLREEPYSDSPDLVDECEISVWPLGKRPPGTTDDRENASDEPLLTTAAEPNRVNDQASLLSKPGSDDHVRGPVENVDDAGAINQTSNPAVATQDNVSLSSFLETEAQPDEENSQSGGCEHELPTAADEHWSNNDIHSRQTAPNMNPRDVDLDRALNAVDSELPVDEPAVVGEAVDLNKDGLVSVDTEGIATFFSTESGEHEHASARPNVFDAPNKSEPRKQMEHTLRLVLLELEKSSP